MDHNIIEYYLVDESGSFLMLDTGGKMLWLMVRTEEDMQTCAELAEDDGLSALSFAFKNHEKIACYPTLEDNTVSAQDWKLYDAIQLKNKPIYYGLLKKEQCCILNSYDILSYEDFLQMD